jgi:hypothetical protein
MLQGNTGVTVAIEITLQAKNRIKYPDLAPT